MGYEKAKRIVKLMRQNKKEQPAKERMFWHQASPDKVVEVLYAIDDLGGAVMFGTNRPGTALRIGVYLENERDTKYCDDLEDVAGFLSRHLEFYRGDDD